MIRRTITTLTLVAVTTLGVATAAPALATAPSSDPMPSIDVPSIDPCIISCVGFDWDLSGLFDLAPGSDEAADPSVTIDVPGTVVDPGILIVDVPIDSIVDLTPPAEDPGTTDPAPTVEEDIERLVPIGPDELRELGGDATPPAATADTETVPSEDPHVEDTDTFATTPETTTTIVTVPEPVTTPTLDATGNTNSTVTSDDAAAATDVALDTPSEDVGTRGGLNVALAALMGVAAAVALGATTTGAYRIGRNRA